MRFLRKIIPLFVFGIALLASPISFAQVSGLSQQNLSAVNVDDLSDEQINQFINQAQLSGLTIEQLEREALTRGLPSAELQKLQERIEKLSSAKETKKKSTEDTDSEEPAKAQARPMNTFKRDSLSKSNSDKLMLVFNELNPKIFGSELFTNKNLTFEPNLKLPTPKNYVIGPDDELVIDIWGASQQTYRKKVSSEGFVKLELVGPVFVNGLTVDQASQRIISRLAKFYAGLQSYPQTTFAQVSIGSIRTIKVTIVGEATLPGTYSLPSLASVFNALYACGGPSANGSYRNIEVVRNNKVIAKLDVYAFLLSGNQKENIKLEDQDLIRIRPYGNRIEFAGEIKRSGFYEAQAGEHLDKLIEYAGGFTNKAYSNQVKVIRNNGKELVVADVLQTSYASFNPQKGDKYMVGKVLPRYQNRILLTGAVFRPGVYSLEDNANVSTLIKNAEGVREDALLSRAVIYRKDENLNEQSFAIDLGGIINGKAGDIALQREDSVVVYSALDLQEKKTISIDGYVQKPGKFPFAKNLTVEDVILQAGGLKEGASTTRIEVSRRIINAMDQASSSELSKLYLVDINPDFALKGPGNNGFKLEPFDVISVRRIQSFVEGRQVTLEGEVYFPGNYAISTKIERISDIVKRAGGLNKEAYPEGAYLIRKRKLTDLEREKRLDQLKKIKKSNSDNVDTASIKDIEEEVLDLKEQVGIDLAKILRRPGSRADLILQDGDLLKIPTQLQTVKLSGEVLYPVSIRYEPYKRLRGYVHSAGGFSSNALRRRTYVIYANGSVKSARNYLFMNDFPKIKPGAEIFVPLKMRRESNVQQTVAVTSALASLALIVVTLVSTLNR